MQPKPWMFIPVIFTTFMQICLVVESLHIADKIVSLPGQPNVGFQQFSGYITVDKKQRRALFYYFVEAETHPASKPLVLWLNGGPGCSSVGAGAFIEHGPFKPDGENLIKNEYSWNKEANMLYLESPAGVGFSYTANKSFYADVNDEITARDNLIFLQRWFVKFPEYKNRDFFIAGESYAGHYIPQLAQLIIKSKVKFNLRGIALGNPLLEFSTDMNSQDEYYWSHGLISDFAYKLLTKVCNTSQIVRENNRGSFSAACITVITQLNREFTRSIDQYDVTADVCLLSSLNHPFWSKFQLLSTHHSEVDAINQQQVREKVDVCVQEKTAKYLNRKDVHKAIHARLVGNTSWNLCNEALFYKHNFEETTIHVVGSLVRSGIPVMVFSGDQDSVIPFTGTRTLVYNLAKELGLKTTVPYRAWFEGKQVGGWTQVYGDILSFAIIRGASHTAPYSQPERSLMLFKAVLARKPLPEA